MERLPTAGTALVVATAALAALSRLFGGTRLAAMGRGAREEILGSAAITRTHRPQSGVS